MPSPEEAKASVWAALQPAASGPSPMEGLASSLPVVESMTAIFLPSQTGKRRWPATSKARPEGESQPAGQVAVTVVGAGVEADDFALVFDVVEDRALAVGGGELGLAGQGDGGDDLARGGVDDGDVVAAAVEGPDGLRGGLEDDAVGVGSGGDGGDGGEGGAVEDDHGVAAAVGDVAELAGGVESDAVGAVEAGDGADGFAGRGVDDVDARAVGDVEAVGAGIGEQVVPAALAADLPVVDDVVGLLRDEEGWRGGDGAEQGCGGEREGEAAKGRICRAWEPSDGEFRTGQG